ncbi:hypothetical protein MF271_02715 [Deinococcus sp. KNUC1210]|uniref:hypothetical protein n=1 Tax=Deinococcus sp. KNUC1210 TaxID=2917691 RepID=UPI001EEF80F3|nr:hypothetical protein [Deinococcus sp. KNUC1210]ULH15580.1 hypothetical protein MF271_02715 [Deinococcus sp. KNUC1210]
MRPEYLELQRLGRMVDSDALAQEKVDEYSKILHSLPVAETEEEVRILLDTFPEKDEGFYGLDWTMLHLLEESPLYLTVFDNYRPSSEWSDIIAQRISNDKDDLTAVQDARDALGIPTIWLTLNIINESQLKNLYDRFKRSSDKNAEHYRWEYFCDSIRTSEDLGKYLSIVDQEVDQSLKQSMLFEIMEHKDCTEDLLSAISVLGNPAVKRKAKYQSSNPRT